MATKAPSKKAAKTSRMSPEPLATPLMEFLGKIGIVASVMGASRKYRTYPVACIALWLEPAIRHEQIYFFHNESGIPIGYMTWAWLAQDTEQRLISDPDVLLHISEWNEGDRLWVLDFVLIGGGIRACLREASRLFAHCSHARSARRSDDGIVRRVTTWRHTAFKPTSQPKR
jgi:cytolysin-activating lysine-acyltransferase